MATSPPSAGEALASIREPVVVRICAFLHRASLDAPLVALLWQEGIARSVHSPPTWGQRVLLLLGVWLAYAGDRLVDTRRLRARGSTRSGSARHAFCARHASVLGTTWLVAAVFAAVLGVAMLDSAEMLAASLMIGFLTLYLGACQRYPILRRVLPREIVVGVSFAVGTTLFCSPYASGRVDTQGWDVATSAFAILCTWNCVVVSWLERDADRRSGEVSLATMARVSGALLCVVGIALGLLATLLMSIQAMPSFSIVWQCLTLAVVLAFAALLLQFARSLDPKRATADIDFCAPMWSDFALLLPAPLLLAPVFFA